MSAKAKLKALEKKLKKIEVVEDELEIIIEPVVCDCPLEDDEAREGECPAFRGGTCRSISTS